MICAIYDIGVVMVGREGIQKILTIFFLYFTEIYRFFFSFSLFQGALGCPIPIPKPIPKSLIQISEPKVGTVCYLDTIPETIEGLI